MHVTGTAKNDISNRIARTTASRWSVRANTFQKLVRQNSWVAPGAVYLFIAWTFANLYYFILPKNLVESVEVLSAFKAQKPMQLRVLVPAIIHFISSYVPLTVSTLDKYILIVGVWAMLIAFALFLRGYVSKSVSYITAPIILVPLTWNCCLLTPFHYPSDIPAIAFFLGCLVLWRAKKITWYYVCFAIACFNRETILFAFPCVMALYWQDSKAREWVKNGVIHLAIYAAIRVILLKIFENSPGIPVVNQFQRNLKLLTDFVMLRNGAVHYFLVLFGGMHLLALLLLLWAPRSLQRLAAVTIIFWGIMCYAGILLETRIFGELIPIYTAIVIVVTARFWPRQQRADSSDVRKIHPMAGVVQ
jgi:hypothetical protein